MEDIGDLEEYREAAGRWLAAHAEPRKSRSQTQPWGMGSDSVAIFHNLTPDEERELLKPSVEWQRLKLEAGYGAIDIPVELGGAGLTRMHRRAFEEQEAQFQTPAPTEIFRVTLGLIVSTLLRHGTEAQHKEFIPSLVRADHFVCQLFSEPGAGSDLAGLSCRAERDGDTWTLNGQKVWTSGATVAKFGLLIGRSDPAAPKHKGMTAFLVPLDSPGVEVRPIRQITGGASFNEVFLSDVDVPDSLRVGEEGDGWKVALTTLGFEREESGSTGELIGGTVSGVRALAQHLGVDGDPIVRDRLADLYMRYRVLELTNARANASGGSSDGPVPGGSIAKLLWTENMRRMGEVVSTLLGPRLAADTGEWGTFAWSEFILGTAGQRIAGGSDEIQRNIIGERVLGLPREPR